LIIIAKVNKDPNRES